MRFKSIPIFILLIVAFALITCKTQGDKKSVSFGGGWKNRTSESALQTKIADADKSQKNEAGIELDSSVIKQNTTDHKLKKPVLHPKPKENFWHSENTTVKSKTEPGPKHDEPGNDDLPVEQNSRIAIILSIIFILTVVGMLLAPISLIFAIIGKRIHKNNPGKYKNQKEAQQAFALSIVMLAILVLIVVLALSGVCSGGGH